MVRMFQYRSSMQQWTHLPRENNKRWLRRVRLFLSRPWSRQKTYYIEINLNRSTLDTHPQCCLTFQFKNPIASLSLEIACILISFFKGYCLDTLHVVSRMSWVNHTTNQQHNMVLYTYARKQEVHSHIISPCISSVRAYQCDICSVDDAKEGSPSSCGIPFMCWVIWPPSFSRRIKSLSHVWAWGTIWTVP